MHYIFVISQPIVRSTIYSMFLTLFYLEDIPLGLIISKVNEYTIVVFNGNYKQFVYLVHCVSNPCYNLLYQQLHTVGSQFFLTFKVFI
jgi:hypothetical protein